MVDIDWKAAKKKKMVGGAEKKKAKSVGWSAMKTASGEACEAYEEFVRMGEVRKQWERREFPEWRKEGVMKPALHALEITFRNVSTVIAEPNREESLRRLERLAAAQLDVIGAMAEGDQGAPVGDMSGSCGEVWRAPGEGGVVVARASEGSLLPRLAEWRTAEEVAEGMAYSVERGMRRCPYTLGVGEPNLSGKACLDYDLVCRPAELHRVLRRATQDEVCLAHQMVECWVRTGERLARRVGELIEAGDTEEAGREAFLVERVWGVVAQILELHLVMDPRRLLRFMRGVEEEGPPCFRSRGLVEMARRCADLRLLVDPSTEVHLLQALHALDCSLKRFFFSYRHLLVVLLGTLSLDHHDPLSRIFLDPSFFPTLTPL